MSAGRAATSISSPVWPWLLIGLGWLAYWRAAGTFFAQDDFTWILRSLTGPSIPAGMPRFLSSGLYFKLLYRVVGLNPVAFHAFNLTLHLATGVALYRLLTGRVRPPLAGGATGLFLSSPALFEALHWVSAITDLLCGFFLTLTALALLGSGRSESGGPRPVGWTAWVAPGFFALALGSKEIAAGAAPLFACLAWRQGGPLRAPRSGLFVALALAAVVPWMGHRASTDPYALHLPSVLTNLPAYLSAAAMGGLSAGVTSDVQWPRFAWVQVAGIVGLALWLVALGLRRSAGGWFGAAWFVALLAPVLFIDRFYLYYLYCALPGLLASLAILFEPRIGRRTVWCFMVGTALVLAQAAQVELRWRATLPTAPLRGAVGQACAVCSWRRQRANPGVPAARRHRPDACAPSRIPMH